MNVRPLICALALLPLAVRAADVEPQPFLSALQRLIEAHDYLGAPFTAAEKDTFRQCIEAGSTRAVDAACEILDRHSLFQVSITPEMRVKVSQGDAAPALQEGGWRQFLIRVDNQAGATASLRISSLQAGPVFEKASKSEASPTSGPTPPLASRWLGMEVWNLQPMTPALSGLGVEYRIIGLYARDSGKREAKFAFDIGQGTQDLGFRNEVSILFNCRASHEITLHILDEDDRPCTASLLIRDKAGRIYPSQLKRLAPDFGFQPQIYRADGETMHLPSGTYDVIFERGPESITETRHIALDGPQTWRFKVKRWTDPSKLGWWSGDHHIHAAGCAHYTVPSEGVHAPDMARHCQGEDLKIGANLTWGPCFDYQKQFFTGKEDKVSQYPFLLRYDIEVSGFGSHKSGHLCLLKLKEQMYPGGESTAHWPTLCLNTLKWAKKQGALCGPAHSGWGLQPLAEDDPARRQPYKGSGLRSATDALPNDIIPPFNGIGANEYIVDVTHEVEGPDGKQVPAVDFMSLADTPHTWELNMWYHTLNAGFRTRASGETDFPCIYGERVGLGRSYVKLDGKLDYDSWCEGIRAGRNYVSDGRSHLMEFQANDIALGEHGSELKLAKPGTVRLTAKVAAMLSEVPDPEIQHAPADKKPYWHLERARIGSTREVPIEVIVNGIAVARKNTVADGTTRDITFDLPLEQSSWVALRVRASSHTNPIFVIIGDKPIRVKRSLEWCLKSVDQCWSQKEALIDAKEHNDAVAAYEQARAVYRQRISEAP